MEKTRIESRRMTPIIFNMENPFNVKGKNHMTKPVNISTIKSRITMTLLIQENISQPHPTRMVYNFSLLSPSVVKTRILFLIITLAFMGLDGILPLFTSLPIYRRGMWLPSRVSGGCQ